MTVTVWLFVVPTVTLPNATVRVLTEMFGAGGAATTVTVACV